MHIYIYKWSLNYIYNIYANVYIFIRIISYIPYFYFSNTPSNIYFIGIMEFILCLIFLRYIIQKTVKYIFYLKFWLHD